MAQAIEWLPTKPKAQVQTPVPQKKKTLYWKLPNFSKKLKKTQINGQAAHAHKLEDFILLRSLYYQSDLES
jgi:hypothetical protein